MNANDDSKIVDEEGKYSFDFPIENLDKDKILCPHCKRTISNGIRCLGMCVEDNGY